MASISKDKNGTRRIQFVANDGKRKAIRLGKVTQKQAETVLLKIEHLVASTMTGHPLDAETAKWVADRDDTFADKLARVGLIPKREETHGRLGEFIDSYINSRSDIKPRTRTSLLQVQLDLLRYFGRNKPIRDITPGDADEWRRWLLNDRKPTLGDNSVRRYAGRAKQFFNAALRKRAITENPFADMRDCTVRANKAREYFVSLEDSAKVLDACPDHEWRLIFSLARFGGLRTPSETLKLRWCDVDWERGRLLVHSPKTEHHEGKETRWIPLFPELREHLEAAFDAAAEGSDFVITRYRDGDQNLRTHMLRIIKRAGLKAWPKLFQNLRSTRETELAEIYPLHVVTAWLGNSQLMAAKHYLQVTDAHFERAAQKAAQQPAALPRNEPHLGNEGFRFANTCQSLRASAIRTVAEAGIEPARPFRDPGF